MTRWRARRTRLAGFPNTGATCSAPVMVARVSDAALDSAVFLLAAWTVSYHLCLVTGIAARWAALVEVLVLPLCLRWAWRASRPEQPSNTERESAGAGTPRAATAVPPAVPRALAAATVLSAVPAAALFAVRAEPWWLTWALWLCAAVAGTAGALFGLQPVGHRRQTGAGPGAGSGAVADDDVRAGGAGAALAWACGLAAFSLFLNRPDADDAYYLNLAGWVADHGSFPLRDTVMSDLAYPATYWPPVASYDGLVGVLARFSPLATLDVAYFVVPVLATFLAVLALWRLLRGWNAPAVGVALTLACVFLLWGGDHHYSFGNHFIGRIWQGKVLFLWLMVPLLLCYLQRFVQGPSLRRLATLFAAGVAGVGLSTNAMFLVPLVAAGGVAPLLFRSARQAATGFVATAAYPLGAAGVTLAVGGYVSDDYASMTEIIVPEWLTNLVLGDGLRAALALLAVLAGALVLRRRDSRVTVGALATIAAVMYAPGMPMFVFEITGLGRTLHRVLWILPVAGLIGALGGAVVSATRTRAVRYGAPLVLAGALIISGMPLWSPSNSPARLTGVPRWKLPPGTVVAAGQIEAHTQPGATILATYQLGHTLAIMDPSVKPVLPRTYFANSLGGVPGFHATQRLYLKEFAKGYLAPSQLHDIPQALRLVGVDMVCLDRDNLAGARLLEEEGYMLALRVSGVRCYR